MNVEKILTEYIEQHPVIDCHEHLLHPVDRAEEGSGFFNMLHYMQSDLISAGMSGYFTDEMSYEEKKQEFLTYYPSVENTSFGRMVLLFAKDLYGIDEITSETIDQMDQQMRQHSSTLESAEAWYRQVFKKMNIQSSLSVIDGSLKQHPILQPLAYVDYLMQPDHLRFIANREHTSTLTLEEYTDYIHELLEGFVSQGTVAGKFGIPYWRSMEFPLEPITEFPHNLLTMTPAQQEDFAGYIFHLLLEKFQQLQVPIQLHTGMVAISAVNPKTYRMEWSNPAPLAPLFARYPALDFILLHTGFPFQEEYLNLTKSYPNAYADLSWIYLIGESLAKENLHKLYDLVPQNKIIGFGGDCQQIEAVYAHFQLAKKVIAQVMAEKINSNSCSLPQAKRFISNILFDNPKRIYRL